MNSRFTQLIDRLQFFGILLGTVLVPLVFYVGNQNIVLLKSLVAEYLVFTLFGLWVMEALENESFELVDTPLNLPVVAYFLWTIATVFLVSSFWFYSLEECARYATAFLLFFLVQKTVRSPHRLKWALWVLFGVTLVTTLYGALQHLGFQIVPWGKSVLVSSFGNKNFFAGFLVLTTPAVFGYMLATRKWPLRIVLGGLFLGQFIMLMETGTRTGFLGLMIGMAVVGGLFLRFSWWEQAASRKYRQLAVILVLVVLAAVIVYVFASGSLFERLLRALDLHRGTGRVRWIMWTGSTRAALASPLAGHGHGVFQLVFPNYRPSFYHRFRVSHNTRHSHNEYMEVLMETGLVGLALFLMVFIQFGIMVYRFLRRNRSHFYRYLTFGLTGAIAGAMAQYFASVNLRWMSTTYTFWLILGLAVAAMRIACGVHGRETDQQRNLRRSFRWLPSMNWKLAVHLGVVMVLVVLALNYYRLFQADLYLKQTNRYIRAAERNRQYWPLAEQAGETSVALNPYNLSAKYKLGFVYLRQGKHRQAYRTYKNLTDLAPNYAQIHNNIALIQGNFNNPYRRVLHFEWATMLEDNLRNHMNLRRQYLGDNRVGTKIRITDRANYHGLFVPWIYRENQRNNVHIIYTGLVDGPRAVPEGRPGRMRRNRRVYIQALRSMLKTTDGSLNELLSVRYTQQASLGDVFRRLDTGSSPPSGLELLSFVRRIRPAGGRTGSFVRSRLASKASAWLKQKPKDPLLRLAVAELMAQLGRARPATRLLDGLEPQLPGDRIVQNTLRHVRETTGDTAP